MATPSSPALSSTASSTLFSNFNYKFTEKLDEKNYLAWLQQVEPVLRLHCLHLFCVAPEISDEFLSEADPAAGMVNPAFTAWKVQDHMLLSWLQQSRSASLLPNMIGYHHTWQLWDHIHQNFHSKVKAQARQLQTELRTIKKGTSTITEFLNKFKVNVSTHDHLDVILEGHPSEFEYVVTLINSKSD